MVDDFDAPWMNEKFNSKERKYLEFGKKSQFYAFEDFIISLCNGILSETKV